ncbi:MAG: phosphoribosyltransferase [Ruegeria sp.]
MDQYLILGLIASFFVGTLSSVFATWLLLVRQRSKFRLHFHSVVSLIGELAGKISKDGYDYDHILALGRNSGVVGSIMAGMVGLNAVASVSMIKRRLPNGDRTIELDEVGESILSALSGKKVLVLLCCNDSGASLQYVVGRLQGLEPAPAEIRTAALYSTPSPVFRPNYSSVIVGNDTKKTMTDILHGLPWASGRWIHPFEKERMPESE